MTSSSAWLTFSGKEVSLFRNLTIAASISSLLYEDAKGGKPLFNRTYTTIPNAYISDCDVGLAPLNNSGAIQYSVSFLLHLSIISFQSETKYKISNHIKV